MRFKECNKSWYIIFSSFPKKKANLPDLKSDVDKLDIDKLKNTPTNFSNLKTKADKLDDEKLVPTLINLSKLSDLIKKRCC